MLEDRWSVAGRPGEGAGELGPSCGGGGAMVTGMLPIATV